MYEEGVKVCYLGTSSALPDATPIGALLRETDTGIIRKRTGELTWLQVGRRVKLSRATGSRMPAGTIKIDRSTKWGNPWRIEKVGDLWTVRYKSSPHRADFPDELGARRFSISQVRLALQRPQRGGLSFTIADVVTTFRNATVGCWCGLDEDCHGDLYLELANVLV